ncbi:unnamed protein product [Diatraea saccharalis]|uniref:Protein kinase domain-containing protein n=1 Tax=Diatraea saccharalis TaxID=40085 RepID=A0A9N9R5S0_9NEOP|nr:unnamed protein product [Diatraea saccharalis]
MPASESSGVGGKAVVVSISVAGAYMLLVLALMLYCRRRRLNRRQRGNYTLPAIDGGSTGDRGEKEELEMAEGREKLVEEEDKKVGNGAPAPNGRLLPHDRDSGADNSEVSAVSRASKKSGQYDHLAVPRSLLVDQITLGRGEFGEVSLAKIDMCQVKKLRNKDYAETEPKMIHVLVKALTAKDEGDLKSFLIATRTDEENAEYIERVGVPLAPAPARSAVSLSPSHRALLAARLAAAALRLASHRLTHRSHSLYLCLTHTQKRCWNKSPTDRPQFSEINDELATILKSVTADNPTQETEEKDEEIEA